jgi:hypothetical protein
MLYLFVLVRAALPRYRYDQLMALVGKHFCLCLWLYFYFIISAFFLQMLFLLFIYKFAVIMGLILIFLQSLYIFIYFLVDLLFMSD